MQRFTNINHLQLKIKSRVKWMENMVFNTQPKKLPTTYSLEKYITSIYDQGQLGSCTANAFCQSLRMQEVIKGQTPVFEPSRLFFYYNERVVENTVNEDSGADVDDGLKYTIKYGVCDESLWPYNISKFEEKPTQEAFDDALNHKIKSFHNIPQGRSIVEHMKQTIVEQLPVLIGIAIYDSFETSVVAHTGIVPMPNTQSETLLGGHEMAVIGFDDNTGMFKVVNSWSSTFGDKGCVYIPYTYFETPDLCLQACYFNI